MNIVAGRATFTNGPPKLYAYVHREVTSAAARLDQFLSRNGVASDERVTVISDDAGEFAKTVEGRQLARGRILDWFHIATKFQAAQRSVFGSQMIDSMDRESVETEITHAKWLVWHGKGSKAVERIKALDSRLLAREGYEFKTLWWNLNTVSSYLKNNGCCRNKEVGPPRGDILSLLTPPTRRISGLQTARCCGDTSSALF